MTTERLRAELLRILPPVRERHILRCLLEDDKGPNQRHDRAHERSFARSKKRTSAGCRFVRSTSGIFLFFLAIENRQSRFESSCGGIAQLVERQLCKLEVRGSNPLASISISDCRLPISDLQKPARKRGTKSIVNRKSEILNSAPSPRRGPVAQLVRACA